VGCSLRIGRAFSLIEVLVALSIFVVLAGLALPSLTNWSPKLVDGAVVSSIQASLDSARAIALERGDVVSVRVVRSAAGRYGAAGIMGSHRG
jgi:prepilin-type N-terminal cleavage/methylation domain-containing protein